MPCEERERKDTGGGGKASAGGEQNRKRGGYSFGGNGKNGRKKKMTKFAHLKKKAVGRGRSWSGKRADGLGKKKGFDGEREGERNRGKNNGSMRKKKELRRKEKKTKKGGGHNCHRGGPENGNRRKKGVNRVENAIKAGQKWPSPAAGVDWREASAAGGEDTSPRKKKKEGLKGITA